MPFTVLWDGRGSACLAKLACTSIFQTDSSIDMKFLLRFLLSLLPVLLIAACGGHAVIKSSEKPPSYDKVLSDLLVVVDESHWQRAFLLNQRSSNFSFDKESDAALTAEERVAARNARVGDQLAAQKREAEALTAPAIALGNAFVSALSEKGVSAEMTVINTDRDRQSAIQTAARFRHKQVLLVNAEAFKTSQLTFHGVPYGLKTWTGHVNWNIRLIDREKTSELQGKPAWNAKTDFFLFGPAECARDAFRSCSERFVASVMKQMSQERLLPELDDKAKAKP